MKSTFIACSLFFTAGAVVHADPVETTALPHAGAGLNQPQESGAIDGLTAFVKLGEVMRGFDELKAIGSGFAGIEKLTSIGSFAPMAASAAAPNAATVAVTKADEPLRVAFGERIDLKDYLVPGKITIFDFTSEGCPPCRMIAPHLAKLHRARSDIAVVAVDINRPGNKYIDWKSPVAVQFGLHSIPHFKVYGADGQVIATDGDEETPARKLVFGWMDTIN